MVGWHAACSLQRARRPWEFVCYLRQAERHEAGRRRFSGLRIRGQIRDEAHGLFGFLTPADKSAPEATGDDRWFRIRGRVWLIRKTALSMDTRQYLVKHNRGCSACGCRGFRVRQFAPARAAEMALHRRTESSPRRLIWLFDRSKQ